MFKTLTDARKEWDSAHELFERFRIEPRVSGSYEYDFSVPKYHFFSSDRFPYFRDEPGVEEITWEFLTGNKQGIHDPSTLLVYTEHYDSGHFHDIFIFHKHDKYPPPKKMRGYIYKDELQEAQEAILKKQPIKDLAYFCSNYKERLDIDIQMTMGVILQIGEEFRLDSPIEFERTTPMFRRILYTPMIHSIGKIDEMPLGQELDKFAEYVWNEIIKK